MDLHNMIPYVASKCKTRRARCHGGQAGRGRQRESGRIKISHIWGRRAAVSRSSQKFGSDGAPSCGRLQPYRRAERDFLRKRRSKGAGGWLVFLSQTKTSRSKADFAPTRRRTVESFGGGGRRSLAARKKLVATARRPAGACNRTGAPSGTFCERGGARERADGLFFCRRQKQAGAKRTLLRRGGEGGILREGLGLLVFQTALLRAVAPRGGGTPHCGLPSSALRIPSFSTAKQDARALHGRPALE